MKREASGGDEAVRLLDELVAERDVLRTVNQYSYCLDLGDEDGFLDAFTEDARYEHVPTGMTLREIAADGKIMARGQSEGIDWIVHAGHEELRAFFRHHTHAPDAVHKHIPTMPQIFVDGDRATSNTCFILIQDRGGGPFITHSGRYLDDLTRCPDGKWRISVRKVVRESIVAGDPEDVSCLFGQEVQKHIFTDVARES